MKICFDYQAFTGGFGGFPRYFASLIREIKAQNDPNFNCSILCLFPLNPYLDIHNRSSLYKKVSITKNFYLQAFLNFANRNYSCHQLKKKHDFDIFHPTYFHPYFLEHLQKKPFVLQIADMIHEIFPYFFSPGISERKKLLAEKASAILTVSEQSKKDIARILSINENKIFIASPGCHTNALHNASSKEILNLGPDHILFKDYFLFVGSRNHYKNFPLLLQAYAKLKNYYPEIHLLCIGGGHFNKQETFLLEKLQIKKKVTQIQVFDEQLPLFYKNALFFIFPSLYEGFGIPLLEAFAWKCPILCSQIPVFEEVCKDSALYFNPHCSHSIFETMKFFLDHPLIKETIIQSTQEKLNLFSWKNCLEKSKECYLKVLGSKI